MILEPCRKCHHAISPNARFCLNCSAPFPSRIGWNGWFHVWKDWTFEWKPPATFFGYPLIHIAIGLDSQFKLYVAKGIIAIGQFAVAYIAIGQMAIGYYARCQIGYAVYLWSSTIRHPQTVNFFQTLYAPFYPAS